VICSFPAKAYHTDLAFRMLKVRLWIHAGAWLDSELAKMANPALSPIEDNRIAEAHIRHRQVLEAS
jgi:hypothetical protein